MIGGPAGCSLVTFVKQNALSRMSFEQTSLTHREGVLLDIDWVHEREELYDKILGEFGDPRLGQSISKRERDQVRAPARTVAPLTHSNGSACSRARDFRAPRRQNRTKTGLSRMARSLSSPSPSRSRRSRRSTGFRRRVIPVRTEFCRNRAACSSTLAPAPARPASPPRCCTPSRRFAGSKLSKDCTASRSTPFTRGTNRSRNRCSRVAIQRTTRRRCQRYTGASSRARVRSPSVETESSRARPDIARVCARRCDVQRVVEC